MARIRSVHPGLFTDEAFVTCSPLARLLAIGIWTECDDQGAFEWKPITLKMRVLPADQTDVHALLDELIAGNIIARFTVDGHDYGVVRNFGKYQRPKKPQNKHPMPSEWRTYANPPKGISPSVPPKGGNGSRISPQMEDGGGRREEGGDLKKAKPSVSCSPPVNELELSPPEATAKPKTKPAAQILPAGFGEWWLAYPRKDDKQTAVKAYARALKTGATPAALLAGLKAWQFSEDPQYQPMPATWINKRRWENGVELAEVAASQATIPAEKRPHGMVATVFGVPGMPTRPPHGHQKWVWCQIYDQRGQPLMGWDEQFIPSAGSI